MCLQAPSRPVEGRGLGTRSEAGEAESGLAGEPVWWWDGAATAIMAAGPSHPRRAIYRQLIPAVLRQGDRSRGVLAPAILCDPTQREALPKGPPNPALLGGGRWMPAVGSLSFDPRATHRCGAPVGALL